jgi:hypothetical protein
MDKELRNKAQLKFGLINDLSGTINGLILQKNGVIRTKSLKKTKTK